jgi:RimJ/RimL family protein N-acetyltransferase
MTSFAEPRIPLALESSRLLLRMPLESDWRALHEYYGDADSVRYTVGTALTEAQTWRTLAGVVGHWAWRGYGPYTLIDKNEGGVLGIAGLWYPNDWPEPEIKWALLPVARGCGFASEAARAVRVMAREHLPRVRLISLIAAGNEASVRVAQAAGAWLEREIDFRGSRAAIYRHPD